MRFTPAIFLALPLIVSAASRPATFFGDRLVARDDDDDDKPLDMNDPINNYCSVDNKAPNDCGSGWCCYYYEECKAGTDGQSDPWCLDHSVTTLSIDPVSVAALQFATTGLPSTTAKPTGDGDDDDKTTAGNGPTNTAATGAAESSGAAVPVHHKVAGALGVGAIAGLAGIFF